MPPLVLLICVKYLQREPKITRVGAQGHILYLFLLAVDLSGHLNPSFCFLRFSSWQSSGDCAHSLMLLSSKNILLHLKLTTAQS